MVDGQLHPAGLVGPQHQPRAVVEALLAGGAPPVGVAELAVGELHRGGGHLLGGRAGRQPLGGGIAGGDRQHPADVPVGVVVGEDRPRHVAALRRAVAAQVAGGGEDRVGRVVDVGDAVAVGVHPVGGEGVACLAADADLHRPGRAGEVGAGGHAGGGGAAMVALDLADRRQHRPWQAGAGVGGRLVERQVGGGDVALRVPARRPAADQRGRQADRHQGQDQKDRGGEGDQQLTHGEFDKTGGFDGIFRIVEPSTG